LTLRNVWLITKNTFRGTITGRWLILFATVFFLIIINIPLIFLLNNTDVGASFLNSWIPYLIALAFPFLPLLALPVGAPMIVEERELGILQFTLSNPVSKMEYLSGKILGLLGATTLVILGAFGLASVTAYGADLAHYGNILLIVMAGAALNCVMTGLALTISLLTKRKATAMGIGLFTWFMFTTISDLGLLSIVVNLNFNPWVTLWIVLLNPVEVGSILAGALSGVPLNNFSATSLVVAHTLGKAAEPVLGLTILIWMFVIIGICYAIFLKQDI
jgi:ABC-type transport system involved in multi-copper enzyme maturation permease subunit